MGSVVCGIGGVILTGAPEQLEAVGRGMVSWLRHRGPDAQGVSLLPHHRGAFAHTRLRIIDLSERGRQPFASPDGQVVLTFNGEIYNFRELRRRLEVAGARFVSDSDTEVILHQYLHHGEAGLDALDGMFAFGLWDARSERLILMRDRLGKKPLYFAEAPGGAFLFASEVKALRAFPGFTLEADPTRLPEYLTFGYVGTPRSFFAGVEKLPPATRLVRDADGRRQVRRYWSLSLSPEPLPNLGVEEAKRLVREAVGAAVQRRLVADVPLGAFLSGGVDSSVIVAEMARRSPGRVRTFAVGFEEDPTWDERRYARMVAERFRTEHTELVVSSSPVDLFEELLELHDEPYGDSSAVAVHAVARATRPHVTVALTGDGGDEVFAGYTRFRGGLVADFVPPALGRALSAVLSRIPDPRGYKHPLALGKRFVAHADRSGDEQLLAWNSFFAGPELAAILSPDVAGPSFDPWSVFAEQAAMLEAARAAGRDRLDQILRHNLATYLLDDLLVKTDRMTMAVALEARSPFLDTALVELAFRLPSALKMRRGSLKWLLREAYRDSLPPEVLDRKKHGFGVPLARWWSGPLSGLLDDLLLAPSARHRGLLEPARVKAVVDEHRSGRRDHGQRIFLLVQLELWLRSLEGQPRPRQPLPLAV